MEYTVKSGDLSKQRTACVVVGVFFRRLLTPEGKLLDRLSNGYLARRLKNGDMTGEAGQSLLLHEVPGIQANRVLLIGCGPQKEFTPARLKKTVGAAVGLLNSGPTVEAMFCLSGFEPAERGLYYTLRDMIEAAEARVYRFDELKSDPEAPKRPMRRLIFFLPDRRQLAAADRAIAHGKAIGQGVALAKTLGDLPGNICTPSYLADQAKKLGRRSRKLRVNVLEEAQMEKLGMGALLSVSKGSRQPAKLILMEYRGGKANSKPVVIIGKGLTFDAGGISIKPAASMDEMKYDMCGGASILGAVSACVELGLPINLIGIVPSSENLPDGNANKPGDIVTSLSGQTIEILNPDAEGRLILCDALTYCERYEPAAVIDVATLTGACVVALGKHASGLFSNNDALAEEILAAGTTSGDRAWRLPLWEDYQTQLDSNFADMANIGGSGAGAVTAACFLWRFAKKFKWAHLDIAGAAWDTGKEKGATGRPVSLLVQFLLKRSGISGL